MAFADDLHFLSEKQPIIEKFIKNKKQILTTVGSQGFLQKPGFLSNALFDLELQTKQALSLLNRQVTAAAIEREMVQRKVDYDLLYKEAVSKWEVSKQTLYSNWEQELADLKKNIAVADDLVEQIAVENTLRQVALINAKYLIDIEIEQIKQNIADIGDKILSDGSTLFKHEKKVAQAKLLLVQEKVKLIPEIENYIKAENDYLAQEKLNPGKYETYLNKRLNGVFPSQKAHQNAIQALIDFKKTLLTSYRSIADKKAAIIATQNQYETKVNEKIIKESDYITEIANFNTALANYIDAKDTLTEPKTQKIEKLQEFATPRQEYISALQKSLPLIEQNITEQETLIAPQETSITKMEDLIPVMQNKVNTEKEYTSALTNQISIHQSIKDFEKQIEILNKDQIDSDLSLIDKDLEKIGQQQLILDKQIALDLQKTQNRNTLLEQEANFVTDYTNQKTSLTDTYFSLDQEATTKLSENKLENTRSSLTIEKDSAITVNSSRKTIMVDVAKTRGQEREKTAKKAAAAKITSQLIHQIS